MEISQLSDHAIISIIYKAKLVYNLNHIHDTE